ncbi:mRNA decay activator protein ZFP36L2-like [Prorops nasuta]|uniref:mRNA decay activator protein ZFP36L2-like n=1 Tax=Prorops nasuta TaxID=863751 RepID=UPI0034CF0EE3
MSTAVMSTPMFECNELIFKNSASSKGKDSSASNNSGSNGGNGGNGNGHTPLRRSYTSLVTTLIEQHRKLDRSVSEPTSRYKTELCRPFEESGACKYGDKCQFAHGYSELRNLARHPKYKTELCRTFHTIGFCPYGPRCHFIHNFEEARIHNQKVSAQLGSTQPNIMGLNPLLSAAAAAAAAAVANNTVNNHNSNVSVNLLEQIAASPQIAAAAAAAAASPTLIRANSLSLATGNAAPQAYNPSPLLRTSSLSLANSQQHHHHHHHHHQQQQQQQHHHHQHHPHHHPHHQTAAISVIGATRPKPLNLSPTFSLGSTGDSVSPSSSLSQSPTNSMASFFSDDCNQANLPTTPFTFGQDFGLLATRQSPSPRNNGLCSSPIGSDELAPRTPSPLSPNSDRLPVFNRISSTIGDFEHLKI